MGQPMEQEFPALSLNETAVLCLPTITIGDYVYWEPNIVLPCLGALTVGLYGFINAWPYRNTVKAGWAYALSFLFFACMMTDAAYFHLVWYDGFLPGGVAQMVSGMVDAGLTSSIAATYLWIALMELGIVPDGTATRIAAGLSYVGIFAAWYIGLYVFKQVLDTFYVLYLGLIGVGCGLFGVSQIVALIRSHCAGVAPLLCALLAGGAGLAALMDPTVQPWLCSHLGKWLNGDFWWFTLSDVAMFCNYLYFRSAKVGPAVAAAAAAAAASADGVPKQRNRRVLPATLSEL